LDEDELTPDEVEALADTFSVGPPAETLLRMAKFPAAAIPVTGFSTSFEFWSLIADKVRLRVMPNGRRELLAAARRRFPYNPKFADPPAADAPPAGARARAGAGAGTTIVGGQGIQIGGNNVQNNTYYGAPPQTTPTARPEAGHRPPRSRTAPVRVLVIGASPSDPDLPYVRADREAHVIDAVARPDRIEVKTVVGAEATDLEKVRTFRPDILHFVCHGEDGCLIFNDTRGEADPVEAERIVELLRHYRAEDGVRLRAIVLAACDGQTLVPFFTDVADVVIGHRGKLADPCGEAFARQLYRLLGDDTRDAADPLDLAAAAREAAQLAAQFSGGCASVVGTLIVRPDAG
jgi:Effector-associated domain 1/CHAT domain